jgi:hypothetical protein
MVLVDPARGRMSDSIYVIGADNRLSELHRAGYDSEDLFQRLLGEHPAMLSLAGGPGGALLLIRREQPVPDRLDGTLRWSLDHLFLDRQGVPVLVEVKQASDTRARREVVAQMLDYAANGIAYWSIEQIVAAFQQTAALAGREPDELLSGFLGDADQEDYWRQVEANLRSGRIRMLFVADRIPRELARIVEFLNEQMRPAEVLALEVEQFTDAGGLRTIVPRLLGATERARTAKAVTVPAEGLSEADWLAQLQDKAGPAARQGAERAVAWLRDHGCEVGITDRQDSLCARIQKADGRPAWPFFLRKSTGRLETSLQYLSYTPPFREEAARRALLSRFEQLPTTLRNSGSLMGWPAIPLADLQNDSLWHRFCDLAADIVTVLKEGKPDPAPASDVAPGPAGSPGGATLPNRPCAA